MDTLQDPRRRLHTVQYSERSRKLTEEVLPLKIYLPYFSELVSTITWESIAECQTWTYYIIFYFLFSIRCYSVGCSFVIGVIVFIPISMIFFGAIYMNECPVSKYIPVYLLIGGIMGIIKPLLTLSLYVRTSEQDQAEERLRQVGTQSMLNWFIFGWFLIGSYWIYREYEPNYNPSKGLYCNHTLYTFAFWLITSAYIICVTFVMVLILLTIISVIINVKAVNSVERTNV